MINGMKMLATGGVYADELWMGNLPLIAEGQEAEAITCAKILWYAWCHAVVAQTVWPEFAELIDYPLLAKYDESDAMVLEGTMCWCREKVFVHANTEKSRGIYVETPESRHGKPSVQHPVLGVAVVDGRAQ